MKFLILFFSLISASHGAEFIQTLVNLLGQGLSVTEKTLSWNAINGDVFDSPQQHARITMKLENQHQNDLLSLVGEESLCPLSLNRRPFVMHREPFDLHALKNYYVCLNRIAEDLFKFTVKSHSVVMDYRAAPVQPSVNQIWFNGKVVVRLSQEKTHMYESQTHDPVYVCFLGFDTPLGYKPVLSICVNSSILSKYCLILCKKYNLAPIECKTHTQSYELPSIMFGATQYLFDDPAQRSEVQGSSLYKIASQYVQSDEACQTYERLNVPAPKSLEQLLNIPAGVPTLRVEDLLIDQGSLQNLNQETRADTTNDHVTVPVKDTGQ